MAEQWGSGGGLGNQIRGVIAQPFGLGCSGVV
jgi:hypothetical protein